MERYDIVIFGASGYTGQYVVEHIANVAEEEHITWCVAGRNKKKLDDTLLFVGTVTNRDLSKIEKIIASVDDEESLHAMCKRARVLINCVGPYRLFGFQVVAAAIANGCHHLDISGEPIYLEDVQLKYNETAKSAKVFVVGATGADSIPGDMGVEFMSANCGTDISGVNTFLTGSGPGGAINYGTWHSAVTGIGDSKMLGVIRRQLFPVRLPSPRHRLQRRNVFYNRNLKAYAVVFPATDRSVAKRTQYYHYMVEKKRPIQIETYLCVKSLPVVIGIMLFGLVFFVMSSFEFGRTLLLKYPEFFSFGMFAKEGAPREQVVKRRYELFFEGKAYETKIEDPDQQHVDEPKRRITAKVSGPDFGYVNCAICIGQCAVTLLKEADKMPNGGGVYPPGAAFAKTGLISRLEKQGVHFEMLS